MWKKLKNLLTPRWLKDDADFIYYGPESQRFLKAARDSAAFEHRQREIMFNHRQNMFW